MTTGDVANPRIWLGADVYVGPLGTTAPTDVTTALNASLLPLGLLSEDGMSDDISGSSVDFFAWGGIYIRTVKSKYKRQIKVVPLEDNKTVWALKNPGSTVSTATAITTRVVKTPVPAPQMMVWHLVDGSNIWRRVIPRIDLDAVAETKFSDAEMTAPELTFNVYTDSASVAFRDITNDPQAVVP